MAGYFGECHVVYNTKATDTIYFGLALATLNNLATEGIMCVPYLSLFESRQAVYGFYMCANDKSCFLVARAKMVPLVHLHFTNNDKEND